MHHVTTANEMDCDEARWHLCRLASGSRLRRRAMPLARHVRDCPACDGFADELAAIRGELSTLADRPCPQPDRASLEDNARRALVRQLEARLARDLLALGQGRACRPLVDRRDDVLRLGALDGEKSVREGLRGEVAATVLERRPVDSGRALKLASVLDPVGIDVALAWLGHLERHGEQEAAHDVASRLLADVP